MSTLPLYENERLFFSSAMQCDQDDNTEDNIPHFNLLYKHTNDLKGFALAKLHDECLTLLRSNYLTSEESLPCLEQLGQVFAVFARELPMLGGIDNLFQIPLFSSSSIFISIRDVDKCVVLLVHEF